MSVTLLLSDMPLEAHTQCEIINNNFEGPHLWLNIISELLSVILLLCLLLPELVPYVRRMPEINADEWGNTLDNLTVIIGARISDQKNGSLSATNTTQNDGLLGRGK